MTTEDPIAFPPHRTFRSQHSLNYIALCQTLVPSRDSIMQLQRAADLVPSDDVPVLLPHVRQVSVTRCKATLTRAHSDRTMSTIQLRKYERYLSLAHTGRSLFEETLQTSMADRMRAKAAKLWGPLV